MPAPFRSLIAPALVALAWRAAAAPAPPGYEPAELVQATPFTLEVPAHRPGGAAATRGLLVVVRADAEVTRARQDAMPVLQLGRFVAAPASSGARGTLVAVVLGDASPADVAFFGPPEIAERVDEAAALARLDGAQAAGIAPTGDARAVQALAAGGAPLDAHDFAGLSEAITRLRCAIEPDVMAAAGAPCAP